MKKVLVIIAIMLILISCAKERSDDGRASLDVVVSSYNIDGFNLLFRVYDRETGVTCYIIDGYQSGGIDCIEGR